MKLTDVLVDVDTPEQVVSVFTKQELRNIARMILGGNSDIIPPRLFGYLSRIDDEPVVRPKYMQDDYDWSWCIGGDTDFAMRVHSISLFHIKEDALVTNHAGEVEVQIKWRELPYLVSLKSVIDYVKEICDGIGYDCTLSERYRLSAVMYIKNKK